MYGNFIRTEFIMKGYSMLCDCFSEASGEAILSKKVHYEILLVKSLSD